MATWYYMINQQDRIGPLEDEAMKVAITNGSIMPNTPVFKVGNTEWKQAYEYQDLYHLGLATGNPSPTIPWAVTKITESDGRWGCEIRFPGASVVEMRSLSQLIQVYTSIQSAILPRLSVGADGASIIFLFTQTPDKPQPAFSSFPLSNDDTLILQQHLIDVANELHRHRLGLWMVDKQLLFRVGGEYRTVPAFWLPAFASCPGGFTGTAPEWRNANVQPQADMYAIAWVCYEAVTGKEYDDDLRPLPGDTLPSAKIWDQFLDQGLRKIPERRPASLSTWSFAPALPDGKMASAEIVTESKANQIRQDDITENSDDKEAPTTKDKGTLRLRKRKVNRKHITVFVVLLAMVIFGGILLRLFSFSSISSGYRRGFGSTVLSYATRSYENSKWKIEWNVNSVPRETFTKLRRISGWDNNNVAVVTRSQGGNLFLWKRSGEWIVNSIGERAVGGDDSNVIFEDRDKLFYATSKDGLYRVTPASTERFICDNWETGTRIRHLGNYDADCLLINSGNGQFYFQNHVVERWHDDEQKKYIFNENGTYADEKDSDYIRHMRSPVRGKLVGILETKKAYICTFKNNRWVVSNIIDQWQTVWSRDIGSIHSIWLLDEKTMVVGTHRGAIIIQNGNLTQPVVNIAGYNPNIPVIAVWGKDLTHYYVMDNKGNILGYDGGLFRIIMRGPDLKKGDIFLSAWVSPEGSVYAITEKEVFHLE